MRSAEVTASPQQILSPPASQKLGHRGDRKLDLKSLDAAHIRDILALPRFVENPRDGIAGFRVMQLIPGMGPALARGMLDHMMGAADPIRALLDAPSPPRAADDWQAFVEMISNLRTGRSGWPAELDRARRGRTASRTAA